MPLHPTQGSPVVWVMATSYRVSPEYEPFACLGPRIVSYLLGRTMPYRQTLLLALTIIEPTKEEEATDELQIAYKMIQYGDKPTRNPQITPGHCKAVCVRPQEILDQF